jgi:hypothetical protein
MNIVGQSGPHTQTHDSGMRSFDVRCTSYNPEASGKYKSCEFMVRCFFDIGRRWGSYEPPRAGTLVHVIGQLIGRYKMGGNEEPAVLITDFKILVSSGKANTVASGDGASVTPTKRRYGPKSSGVSRLPVTPETSPGWTSRQRVLLSPKMRGRNEPLELFSGDEEGDVPVSDEEGQFLSRAADSSTLSGSAEINDSAHPKDKGDRDREDVEAEKQQRPKRVKRGKGREL